MSGKLIVIDGLDGCGKSTQVELLYNAIKKLNGNVRVISYPDYEQPSSTLVKMYLNGDFSKNPDDVNAYAASSFYAIDRYASYMQFWGEPYKNGDIIIAARYVSSNAIHQMVKLGKSEWDKFLSWLDDYEFEKLGLPREDKTIFLDMPRNVANALITSRYSGDETRKDIHESNLPYLEKCQESAAYAAKKLNWSVVSCSDGINAYSTQKIADEILKQVLQIIDEK